jgi:hypothetical protein
MKILMKKRMNDFEAQTVINKYSVQSLREFDAANAETHSTQPLLFSSLQKLTLVQQPPCGARSIKFHNVLKTFSNIHC